MTCYYWINIDKRGHCVNHVSVKWSWETIIVEVLINCVENGGVRVWLRVRMPGWYIYKLINFILKVCYLYLDKCNICSLTQFHFHVNYMSTVVSSYCFTSVSLGRNTLQYVIIQFKYKVNFKYLWFYWITNIFLTQIQFGKFWSYQIVHISKWPLLNVRVTQHTGVCTFRRPLSQYRYNKSVTYF